MPTQPRRRGQNGYTAFLMSMQYVPDYEAITAWSGMIAAFGTVAAVVVALWQANKAARDTANQQRYRNWLEQKRLEENHLTRMLDMLNEPFRTATEFFFSGTRLLAGIPSNIAPTPQQDREVHEFVERFARETGKQEATVYSYINIVAALRELHRTRGANAEADEYDGLLDDVTAALNKTADLREWLSDVDVIRATPADKFDELPLVNAAREAINAAERRIARRLVRLYANPPND